MDLAQIECLLMTQFIRVVSHCDSSAFSVSNKVVVGLCAFWSWQLEKTQDCERRLDVQGATLSVT